MAAILRSLPLLLPLFCNLLSASSQDTDHSQPLRPVSIDDVIDLDAAPSDDSPDDVVLTSYTETEGAADTTVGHGNFIAPIARPASPPLGLSGDVIRPSPRHLPMTSDDEDIEISGDGSGSGDDAADIDTDSPLTSVGNATTTTTASSGSHDLSSDVPDTTDVITEFVVKEGGETVTGAASSTVTSENQNVGVSDVVYNGDVWPPQPVKEHRDQKQEHQRWSRWIRTNDVTEVRLRTCAGSEESCNGTEAELRHCDVENKTCDVINAFVTSDRNATQEQKGCADNASVNKVDANTVTPPVPTTPGMQAPPTPPTAYNNAYNAHHQPREDSNPCAYSLYDVKRGKFVAAQWSLSRLVTQAKVKKWCSSPERFLVMYSPFQHCRRYFSDLCHVSVRCKGRRTLPRTHGDFTDTCWRRFAYGERLPTGLTDRWANVYLLCQRFAALSALGQRLGPDARHFVTLYDTKGRSPVVSMIRLTQLGDLAWPHTSHFIEHGLLEDSQTSEWLLQKPKAGMVQLSEIGLCSDHYSCQHGAHQALPSDYSATTYRPAPLLWPELAGPSPWAATATMTLTNMAPMHAGLYPVWHRAVLRVRHFAAQQCGLPSMPMEQFRSFGSAVPDQEEDMRHRKEGSATAAYVISGAVPSRDPMESIGNDVNVPTMFWLAVCCVATRNTTSTTTTTTPPPHHHHHHHHSHHHHHPQHHSPNHPDHAERSSSNNYVSFAIYASNAGSSEGQGQRGQGQVVVAPVAELEQVLEDQRRRSSPREVEEVLGVQLFPGSEGACSHPASDLSAYLHL